MKAMILAAGLGTRLKPLTDSIPKALVEVNGVPILERLILKLKSNGFDYIVVNVHHLGEQIVEFLKNRNFGIEINISDEREELLDTGGGLVKAGKLLFEKDRQSVLIHNVDILSNANLNKLMAGSDKEIKLLVSERDSGRKLIFDEGLYLKGWHNLNNNEIKPCGLQIERIWKEYAFSGIYTMTFDGWEEMQKMKGEVKFPIMDYFLESGRKTAIKGEIIENLELLDIGKPATLSQARGFINRVE